jgi:hypothetical protein
MTSLNRFFKGFYKWSNNKKISFMQKLQAYLYLSGIGFLFNQENLKISATLLTSNSFTTELLRFYLLQKKTCDQVCEIEHGLPTIYWKEYVLVVVNIAEKFGAKEKHSTIPQLPNLPVNGSLYVDVKCGKDFAINTYLNKFFVDVLSKNYSVKEYIENEYKMHFAQRHINDHSEQKLLISFIGTASAIGAEFINTRPFQLEIMVINRVRNFLIEMGIDYLIVYTPHPLNSLDVFLTHTEFNKPDIIVYKSTMVLWFIADLSISFNSGALFEAAFFGAHALLLVHTEDKIFDESLLTFVSNLSEFSNDGRDEIYDCLRCFLQKYACYPAGIIMDKIRHRLSKVDALQKT